MDWIFYVWAIIQVMCVIAMLACAGIIIRQDYF